jgi:hypothetical protein
VKTWGLRIVVMACLVAAAFWLRGRGPAPQAPQALDAASPPAKPDWSEASRAVNAFFQAAADGDDKAYLNLLDGRLRRSLDQTRSDLGVEEFCENLRRSSAGVKGVAVTPGPAASAGEVVLNVEIVFADRNENQQMRLVRQGKGWVITSIDQSQMIKPVVPYGTPVFEESPEP